MLTNSPSFPLTLTRENYEYVCARLDDLSKVNSFKDYCNRSGYKLKTEGLESTIYELTLFKRLWKRFQDRFIFKKYNEIRIIGMIERGIKGESRGMLHAHLFVAIPLGVLDAAAIGQISADLRRIWSEVHKEATGRAVGGNRMALEDPNDKGGEAWARYICKAFNRGKTPAKWGSNRNQSFLLTARVRELKLWRRNGLPSRNKAVREATLQRFNQQIPEDSGTLRSLEAA